MSVGDLVLGACCGTTAPGLADLLWPKYCHCLGCEKDRNCVAEDLPSLVETSVKQILTKESDLAASKYVLCASNTLFEALDKNAAKKRADVWTVTEILAHVQTFRK